MPGRAAALPLLSVWVPCLFEIWILFVVVVILFLWFLIMILSRNQCHGERMPIECWKKKSHLRRCSVCDNPSSSSIQQSLAIQRPNHWLNRRYVASLVDAQQLSQAEQSVTTGTHETQVLASQSVCSCGTMNWPMSGHTRIPNVSFNRGWVSQTNNCYKVTQKSQTLAFRWDRRCTSEATTPRAFSGDLHSIVNLSCFCYRANQIDRDWVTCPLVHRHGWWKANPLPSNVHVWLWLSKSVQMTSELIGRMIDEGITQPVQKRHSPTSASIWWLLWNVSSCEHHEKWLFFHLSLSWCNGIGLIIFFIHLFMSWIFQ